MVYVSSVMALLRRATAARLLASFLFVFTFLGLASVGDVGGLLTICSEDELKPVTAAIAVIRGR